MIFLAHPIVEQAVGRLLNRNFLPANVLVCSQGHEHPYLAYVLNVINICDHVLTCITCWQYAFFLCPEYKKDLWKDAGGWGLELLPPLNKVCVLSQLYLASSFTCQAPKSISQGLSLCPTHIFSILYFCNIIRS